MLRDQVALLHKGLRPLNPVCNGSLASLTPVLRSLRKAFYRLLAPKLRLHSGHPYESG